MQNPKKKLKGRGSSENGKVTRTLGNFVVDLTYSKIPKDVIEFAKLCILDLFGSAFAAIGFPISKAAGGFLDTAFGKGKVTRWDSGDKVSILGATWINSVLGSAIDIDDGHRLAIGHPGSSIIPAALALSEQEQLDGKRLLEAVVAGYEVGIRVSFSRNLNQVENVATGHWGGYGAAVAASKLLFDSAPMVENTIGLVSMYSPRLPGYFPGGRGMVKEGIPWAAVSGVSAALLNYSGFKGPQNVIDHLAFYQPQKILQGLGEDFFILKTYFKKYPCCRWIHPIIEGCLSLMEDNHFQISQINKIRIQTFSRAFSLPNRISPESLEDAQFSIPFCTVLALQKKEIGFRHILIEDLCNPEVIRLSEKVVLEHNPDFDNLFPEKIVSRISIDTSKGHFERVVSSVKGDLDDPFSEADLVKKYLGYAHPILGEKNAFILMNLVKNLENIPISDLVTVIGSRSTANAGLAKLKGR